MMTEQEELRNYCQKVQEKGPIRLILQYGIPFGLLNYLILGLFSLDTISFSEAFLSWAGLKTLLFSLLAGILVIGPIMWWVNGRTIRKIDQLMDRAE